MAGLADIPEPGTRVIMVVEGYFGNEVNVKGTITGEPYHHGYNLPGGGWGLYDTEQDGEPCYKVPFREYRKQNVVIIPVDRIFSLQVGWNKGA